VVRPETPSTPAVLYVDLHLVHEVTSPQAFSELRNRGARVRRPDLTLATMDHSTPTTPRSAGRLQVLDSQASAQLEQLQTNCDEFGIRLFGLDDTRQGIVHVIGPEQGLTQPGMTIVCGDSHEYPWRVWSAAFGIGTSEVGYVLATQTLLQRQPRNMEVRIDGVLLPELRQRHHPRNHREDRHRRRRATFSSTPARRFARSAWRSG
jgi:3-isopropylmalate/(R)-2-methylmalate dehydratase large subunit